MKILEGEMKRLRDKYYLPQDFKLNIKSVKRLYDSERSSGKSEENASSEALKLAEQLMQEAVKPINAEVNTRADKFLQSLKTNKDVVAAISAAKDSSSYAF